MKRSGHTLIEILLTLLLVGLLASLILPTLATVKDKARRLKRLSSLRQSNAVMLMYGNDYDGQWPNYTLAPPDNLVVRARGHVYVVPYFHGYSQWHVILSEQYLDGYWESEAYAPGGDRYIKGGAYTAFFYSASLRARPDFWDHSMREGPAQWLSTRQYETTYTSEKTVLVDYDSNLSGSATRHLPLAMADGSVVDALSKNIEKGYDRGEGHWFGAWFRSAMPGMHTIDGVRGRDYLR